MQDLIWIIDDDEGILEVSEIVLNDAGFRVAKINSEEVFHAHLSLELPKLVLLDVRINGVDGKKIARELRAHEKTKNTPIILMSADVDIEKKAKEAHANDFLKKPFDIEDLEKIVKEYLLPKNKN